MSGAAWIAHVWCSIGLNSAFPTDYLSTNGTIRLPFASHWKNDVLRLGDLHVCVFTNYDPFLALAAPLNVLMEADDSGVVANINFPEWFCNTMTF